MVRQIKFRAWDGERMRAWGSCDFIITASGPVEILEFSQRLQASWHLMQFTGLHDKNGVEIYEGDIVLHEAFPGAKSGKEVVFLDGWVLNSKGLETDVWKLTRNTRYSSEVIGNIHQNPELLP